jgi:hypothetical protein
MVIDSSTGSGTRAREPSHDELFANVAIARSRGVGNVEAPLDDLAALLWAARNGCPASHDEDLIDDAERIEYVLRLAVSRLGGKSAQAIEALLGLSMQTRGRTVRFRRGVAAELYGKSRDTFRTHFETSLLMAVVTNLLTLVDERRLATLKAKLLPLSKDDENSPKPSVLDLDDDWENEPAFPFEPIFSADDTVKMGEKQKRK